MVNSAIVAGPTSRPITSAGISSTTAKPDRSSGEVAIADEYNNRVQIFDLQGNFKRKSGSRGEEDGQFRHADSLASDAYGNILVTDFNTSRLQVFNSKGEHLCTCSDLGLKRNGSKGLAWGALGQLAVANGNAHGVRVWY